MTNALIWIATAILCFAVVWSADNNLFAAVGLALAGFTAGWKAVDIIIEKLFPASPQPSVQVTYDIDPDCPQCLGKGVIASSTNYGTEPCPLCVQSRHIHIHVPAHP